ncbi:MAG: peptidylprolyl isomerase [Flavobacteriales bacterium]
MKKWIRNMLTLAMALASAMGYAQPLQLIDGVIGTVGNEIVLYSDLQATLSEMQASGQVDDASMCGLLENLMYQKLLLNQSKLDSIEVSDAEVQQQVEQRLDYFIRMFGSTEEFEKYYNKTTAQLKNEYFDLIRDQLLVQRMQEEVTKNLKVTPADVKRYYESVPQDSLPLIGEQVQYSQIVIQPEIRQEEIERVMHVLDSLRSRLVAGRSTMKLEALKWSEDPGSKRNGGCYPLQRRGTFVPEYEAAVYNTGEGMFTPVFKSEFGYHIVKVIEKRGEYYESCHILMSPQLSDEDLTHAYLRLDSVKVLIDADSIAFAKAAIRYSTDKDTRNAGGRIMNSATGGTKHDVAQLPAELNLILMDLKPGDVSDPVLTTMPDGTEAYVIYKLDSRMQAHVANIKDDYEIFLAVTTGNAKQAEADKWVRKKLSATYSHLHPDYADCEFQFPWGSGR